MRILQVVQQPSARGAEVFASDLSRVFRDAGHSCSTVYLYPAPREQLALSSDDMLLGGSYRNIGERVAADPLLLWRLREHVRKWRPDVLQLNGARTVKYGALLYHLQRSPAYRTVYRNIGDPLGPIMKRARSPLYRRVVFSGLDGVVALTESAATAFREVYRIRAQVAVIPNAVSTDRLASAQPIDALRASYGLPRDAVVGMFIGQLAREKRLDRLLRAFEVAAETVPTLWLFIVGSGSLTRELQAQASRMKAAGRIRFVASRTEIGAYYRASDFVVLASDSEGMPAVLIEAGHLGLPVVATRVGFVGSCVDHGVTGLLVEQQDERGLADAMAALAVQPALRSRLGEAARNLARSRFDFGKVAEQYLTFYRALRGVT